MIPSESATSPMMPPSTSSALNPKQFPKSALMYILLAALFFFVIIFFIMTSSSDSYRHRKTYSSVEVIHQVCKASRDPAACQSSLTNSSHVPPESTVLEAVQSALYVASKNHATGVSMVREILVGSADNKNRSDIAKVCLEILGYSDHRINSSGHALPRGGVKDPRAWMSAALAYQYGCMSGLKNVNDTPLVRETVDFFNNSVIVSTGNVLAMMANYDFFGDTTKSWAPPMTEREGFWEPVSGSSGSGPAGVPSGLKAKVTVCNGTSCDYSKIQDAVDAAPDNSESQFVIWIKTGIYEETVRVPLEKKNLVFLGDGMGKTVITGSSSVGLSGVTTYNTATVGVLGDGFMATGLTIENTAGPGAYQAVAFRSDSDLSVIENCEFLGNQDTLYAHALRQYYTSCRIQGNIDFIFGHSASYFQDCLILVAPRQLEPEKGEQNTVTAHARIDRAQSTGFIFQNCVINATDAYMSLYNKKPSVHESYLGRPWKEYSRTVFIDCTMDAIVSPDGWMPWSGDFALDTLYFGEFGNRGPGSDTSKRVNWSSQIPADHVDRYTSRNFMKSDRWLSASS